MSPLLAAVGVLRRLLLTPARIGIGVLLGALFTILSLVANRQDNAIAGDLIDGGLLVFVVPIVALIFAVGALGDLRDDGTLVYVWLQPLPRWQLGLASVLATWLYVVPIAALTAAGVVLAGGEADLLLPAVAACGLAAMAYATIFVGLGLRTTRSLLVGLVFVLIWEGFLAGLSEGVATLSVRRWSSALFADLAQRPSAMAPASSLAAVVVLGSVVLVGGLLTSRWLATRDIP